jgi:hypothetical protein
MDHHAEGPGTPWAMNPALIHPEFLRTPRSTYRRNKMRKHLWQRRDSNRRVACHWCGRRLKRSEFTLDHLEPLCLGGEDTLKNVVSACAPCNFQRSIWQGREYERLCTEWLLRELRMVTPVQTGLIKGNADHNANYENIRCQRNRYSVF